MQTIVLSRTISKLWLSIGFAGGRNML